MTSDMWAMLPPLNIQAEAENAERFPAGSRQRMIGLLWVEWLQHIQRCQIAAGCCPRYRDGDGSEELERRFPHWDCCEAHRKLQSERSALIGRVHGMHLNGAPHQTDEVLSTEWWMLFGKRYDIRRRIVSGADSRKL